MDYNVQNDVLSGKNNNRLNKTNPIHKEDTAAWSETAEVSKEDNVSIPSSENVIDAKEWVDDGSRL